MHEEVSGLEAEQAKTREDLLVVGVEGAVELAEGHDIGGDRWGKGEELVVEGFGEQEVAEVRRVSGLVAVG